MTKANNSDNQDVMDLSYSDALTELEHILNELESSMVDVDALATKVGRASALVAHCKTRLSQVRSDVADVVADLDEQSQDA